ncbi:hypothetical protein [Polyangium spumosum]|uniref:Uncharacterized protein n=1 Tax=Polyangium spumosum TaxID=889282 RepID=A0A6N7PZE5_9BACT|nr:hypothetical protein [Polyangium spumosum]MRG96256.1 hypothetical protein [Polyangium spumosum]
MSTPVAPPWPLDPPAARGSSRRLVEFLLVGGVTPFLFALSFLLRRAFGLDPAEYAVGFLMFHAAFVINDPHFAVTYLLFYKDTKARVLGDRFPRPQRIRYLVAGFVAPALLGALVIVGLVMKSAFVLSLLVRLMFFLVGWHYVKQGFGVFTVLAARRGVRFAPRERLVVLAHCFAGWAYAWASPADPGRDVEEKGLVYTTLATPLWLEHLTHVVFLSTLIPLAWVLVRKWRRDGRLPILTPLTALLCSIWSWSIYSSVDPLVRYVIPALHSVQYLYFVWLLKGNEAREREGPPWFERSARTRLGILAVSALGLGWFLFHGAPSAFDEALGPRGGVTSEALGPTPYFVAIFAFVNIHHYLMDTVIWRRENPETRYLQEPALGDARRAS